MECMNGSDVGSKCSFYCGDDFALIGPYEVTCVEEEAVMWTNEVPTCESRSGCDKLKCDVNQLQCHCPTTQKKSNNSVAKFHRVLNLQLCDYESKT